MLTCFSQNIRGRWYLNVVLKAQAKPTAGTASVGIDLGLKGCATTPMGEKIEGHFYRKLQCQLGIALVYRLKHLPHLVRFGLAARILNVDARITLPRAL